MFNFIFTNHDITLITQIVKREDYFFFFWWKKFLPKRRETSDALIVTGSLSLSTINFSPARTRAYLRESTRQMSELRERGERVCGRGVCEKKVKMK